MKRHTWPILLILSLFGVATVLAATPPPRAYFPLMQQRSPHAFPRVVLGALLYDGVTLGDGDEAFALWNMDDVPINVAAWQVSDGRRAAILPSLTLLPRQETWCARDALSFQTLFGDVPSCEYGTDAAPDVPNAGGNAPRFANAGGRVTLLNAAGVEMDTLIYKSGSPQLGWEDAPLQPVRGFREAGQILYRKWVEHRHQVWPDTNRARDWAQDPLDVRQGQRVRYPGWELERFWAPATDKGFTTMTAIITPDASDAPLLDWLNQATRRIDMAVYALRSPAVAQALVDAAARNVVVRVLVEGRPVGGLSAQERALLDALDRAGVQVMLLVPDRQTLLKRYRYMHAKYIIIDGTRLVVSTENFSPDAFPPAAWGRESAGRRGVLLLTDAPAAVRRAEAIFEHDADTHYTDVFPYVPEDPDYGAPNEAVSPPVPNLGYRAVFTRPLTIQGVFTTTLLTAPENALYTEGGLLGVVDRAGPGDTILVMGLYEHLDWTLAANHGDMVSNPRWLALFDAAARGARVRVLLDSFFIDSRSTQNNRVVAERVNGRAQREGWDMEVRLGNPTGLGLHAKVYLVDLGEERWSYVGSMNGSAVSHKANREMALLVASPQLHTFLAQVFWHDWDGAVVP